MRKDTVYLIEKESLKPRKVDRYLMNFRDFHLLTSEQKAEMIYSALQEEGDFYLLDLVFLDGARRLRLEKSHLEGAKAKTNEGLSLILNCLSFSEASPYWVY